MRMIAYYDYSNFQRLKNIKDKDETFLNT